MELVLLRHGKAEDDHPQGDAARDLVAKGVKQAARAGQLLRGLERLPTVVLTSPRRRALRTAEVFCEAAGLPGPVVEAWLDCGMSPETALGELAAYADFGRVMIVGHEPDFSELAGWLLGCAGDSGVEVKKGSLVGLECDPPARGATLLFAMPPAMVAGGS